MERNIYIYLFIIIPFFVFAQETSKEDKKEELDSVVVTANRKKENIKEVTSSITIVSEKKIQTQLLVNTNISNILQYTVPSLATSSNQTSNFGQTLRGRPFLVMIDGIPQSTPLRNGGRDVNLIDPSSVERIEVIKGATSIYGNGADGGIINYITKKNHQDKKMSGYVGVGITTEPSTFAESAGYRTSTSLNGKNKGFDYVLGFAYDRSGLLKDANSVNISPMYSLANLNVYNGLIKLGYELSEKQRVEVSYIGYASKSFLNQDTKVGKYGEIPTIGIETSDRPGEPEGTPKNHNLRISYNNSKIWKATSLNINAYLQDFKTVYAYDVKTFIDGGQSNVISKKLGLRANFDTNIIEKENYKADLVYGLDILRDATVQKLEDRRFWTPQMNMQNFAPFALIKFDAWNGFTLKAGARYENIKVLVEDFNTLSTLNTKTNKYSNSVFVEGGNLEYNALVGNIGARYNILPSINIFSSYSQSFSINELGRILRTSTTSIISKLPTDPVIVNNYEVGLTGVFQKKFFYEITSFWSTSKLGASLIQQPDGFYTVQRAPEKIWGYEVVLSFKPTEKLSLGSSFAWIEGKVDSQDDGSYEKYLNGSRIMSPKLTSYIQIRPTKKLDIEISFLHNFSRNRFDPDTATNKYVMYEGAVPKYTTFNLSSFYKINKQFRLGLGIENMFNKNYSPNMAWWMARDQDYVKAPGRRATLQLQYFF